MIRKFAPRSQCKTYIVPKDRFDEVYILGKPQLSQLTPLSTNTHTHTHKRTPILTLRAKHKQPNWGVRSIPEST